MPSLISQLRNGTPSQPQTNLNQSIEQTRNLMSSLQMMRNPSQAILNMANSNPQIAQIIQLAKTSGMSLEQVARQMAAKQGIDVNEVIRQLGIS